MFLEFSDWLLYADRETTKAYSAEEAQNHCTCGFCRNFYRTVDRFYPNIRHFLSRFGMNIEAPESLIPITHWLYQASYAVRGRVLRWGSEPIQIDDIPVTVEEEPDGEYFILNLGIMKLPWVLDEDPVSVAKPGGIIDLFADFKK